METKQELRDKIVALESHVYFLQQEKKKLEQQSIDDIAAAKASAKAAAQAAQYSQFKTMFGDLLQVYIQREVMPKIKKLIKQQVMDHLTIDIDEQWEPYSGQEHPYLDGSVKWRE